ncbi:MAG: hypothetical protein DCC75_08790, partial [Proteobacteria bacterium]
CFAQVVSDGGMGGGSGTMQGYADSKTKKVIDDRMGQSGPWEEVKRQVEQEAQDWLPSKGGQGAGSSSGGKRMDNFHGAEMGEVTQRFIDDSKDLIENFHVVNDDPVHTFMQIVMPPTEVVWNCGVHYQYIGFESGTCYWIKPGPLRCGGKWYETSSLVDYRYPAYKLNVSEQMWQTAYIPKEAQEPIIEIVNDLISSMAPMITTQAVMLTFGLISGELAKAGIDVSQALNLSGESEHFKKMLDEVSGTDAADIRQMSPSLKAAHSRNIFEPLNLLSLEIDHIPHVAKFHLWSSDHLVGIHGTPGEEMHVSQGGYFHSQILALSMADNNNSEWRKKKDKYFTIGGGTTPGYRRCIANNKAVPKDEPKTPRDIDDSAPEEDKEGEVKETGEDICVDLVGESFPFLDWRRPHISDATYQAAWKYLNLFLYLAELKEKEGGDAWEAERHSFWRDIDKWFVLHNEDFREDQEGSGKQAKPFDQMAMINVEFAGSRLKYDRTNVKVAKSGGENTFEIWPLFKGCFYPGRKGEELEPASIAKLATAQPGEKFFIEERRPPLMIPPVPWPLFKKSIIPDKLRLY